MPANYSLYRFGNEAMRQLPASQLRLIQRFRRLYNAGLHGQDLFFYYRPTFGGPAADLYGRYNSLSGREFFAQACDHLKEYPSEGGLVCLYGLLGHYCLDSLAHPYVKKHAEAGEARHVEMETEFDRFLLESEGRIPPQQQDFSAHMKLTRGECVTVAEFYGTTPGVVLQCIRHMVLATRILATKKRKVLEKLLKLTPASVSDQLMHETANARCEELTKGLQAYYSRALKRYPMLLEQLMAHMQTGDPLGDDFEPNFG